MAAFNKEENKPKEKESKMRFTCPVCQKYIELEKYHGNLMFFMTCRDCGCGTRMDVVDYDGL